MSKTMSKTRALKVAREATSIYRTGGEWGISGPYRASEINGPQTERRYASHSTAQAVRAEWIAEIAAVLIGIDPYCVAEVAERAHISGATSAERLLALAIDRNANHTARGA